MLAVDRTNEKVAALYQPYHPAVLRALKKIVDAARRHGKEVSICGDMAHDERFIAFLIGIGFDILSVDPLSLPKVQKAIAQLDAHRSAKNCPDNAFDEQGRGYRQVSRRKNT